MDAFVLLLAIFNLNSLFQTQLITEVHRLVSPHGPPFSKVVESTSDGIDGPWIVTHIGQGGMADDWWQSGGDHFDQNL